MFALKRLRGLALALGAAAILIAPVAGVASSSHHASIKTITDVNQILASRGIDPSTAIVQRGGKNYAGPTCPGVGWTCATPNQPVVQMSGAEGTNEYECTPSTSPGPDECVIVQTSDGADNNATCIETTDENNAEQKCDITQTNTTGANNATVKQTITHVDGSTQTGSQTATLSQTNESGSSTANVTQSVDQSEHSEGDSTLTQDSHQKATVTQDSTAGGGDNNATVSQDLHQHEVTKKPGTVTHLQNTADEGRNLLASIDQKSSDGGQEATLSQSSTQQQQIAGTGVAATQTQTTEGGGHEGTVNQDSTGISNWTVNENESQVQQANGIPNPSQSQWGPIICCSSQGSNPLDTCTLNQTSSQEASSGTGGMHELLKGHCRTSGTGTVHQSVIENGQETTNDCTGSDCDKTIGCENGVCTTTFPEAQVNPSSIAFGAQLVGSSSASRTVTVTNSGEAPLVVTSVSLDGANPLDFALSGDTCSGASIDPMATCTFDVAFAPTVAVDLSAIAAIVDNAEGSPHSVSLSGSGITDTLAPSTSFTTSDLAVLIGPNGDQVAGTATDDLSGVASVTVTYDLLGLGVQVETIAAVLTCGAGNLSCTWTASLPSLPGIYTVTATATDAAGNTSGESAAITIIVI